MKYAWNPESAQSYAEMKRRRDIAKQLGGSIGSPKNVGEGLNAIGTALMARAQTKKADRIRDQLASGPNVSPELLQSLYGLPAYRRGTSYHPGGMAIVGEDGPEIVNLPRGAAVQPNQGSYPDADDATGRWIPDPTGIIPPEMIEDYEGLPTVQQMRAIQDIGGGGDPKEIMLRELEGRKDMFELPQRDGAVQPGPSLPPGSVPDIGFRRAGGETQLMDDQAVRQAQLDAFKLMDVDPQYGAPAEADLNTTEGGRLALLRRMMFSDLALEDPRLAKALTRMDENFASNFGAIGRLYTSDEYELGQLMAEQFANAVLRNDSGAQAPEPEVQRYARQYFPQPNEGERQLQAKKVLRREVIRAMMQALGGDAAPAVRQVMEEMEMLRQAADVPDQPANNSAPDADSWTTVNGVRIRVKN